MGDREDQGKKRFRQLPEKRNKDEEGQGKISLAPMLHWDIEDTPAQQREMKGKSIVKDKNR